MLTLGKSRLWVILLILFRSRLQAISADSKQVKIIGHFCRLWVVQDYKLFLQTLGKFKKLTKLL